MGFDWIRRLFIRRARAIEMVPYLDVENRRIVRIPASELLPGVIQAKVSGADELVWVSPEEIEPGEVCHPPFEEEVRGSIRQIRDAFYEHRPLTMEQWEDGFRRDANPEIEIALWNHAADVYTAFAAKEASAERRHDFYRVVVTCLTTTRETVWHVLRPEILSRHEAQRVVNRFFDDVD